MTATPLLYKVLTDDGHPAHGGTGTWPLPKGKRPGAWHTVDGDLEICQNGLHLTSDPLKWWKPGARLYLAEADITGGMAHDNSDKAAFGRVRLVQEITKEWPYLPLFARLRCFLAASERSRDGNADISWAYLSRADLSRAYLSRAYLSRADRPIDPPAGWTPGANGLLQRAPA